MRGVAPSRNSVCCRVLARSARSIAIRARCASASARDSSMRAAVTAASNLVTCSCACSSAACATSRADSNPCAPIRASTCPEYTSCPGLHQERLDEARDGGPHSGDVLRPDLPLQRHFVLRHCDGRRRLGRLRRLHRVPPAAPHHHTHCRRKYQDACRHRDPLPAHLAHRLSRANTWFSISPLVYPSEPR